MDYRELAQKLIKYQLGMPKPPKNAPKLEANRGEMSVIVYLIEFEDGVAPGILAQFGDVSTARMATVLNKLEEKGYITRSTDPNDRRKIIVNLTPTGRAFGTERKEARIQHIASMLNYLGEHDAKEFIRLMKRVNEFYKEDETKKC